MSSNTDKIAVIGISGRFPGANNINEYWENLVNGKETISLLSDDCLSKYEVNFNALNANPNYVKARGVLDNIDLFDPSFFGMTPKDAMNTDPQHRIWLETAWDAFENAGVDPFSYQGAIGVYAGSYINTYLLNNILRDPIKYENYIRLRSPETFQLMTSNDAAYIPTRTAYKFNLKGPAINVQTACSTSLVAIIQACQSLFSFESDICLAGGVCILTPQETGYVFQEGAIPSPDGHCRPFDANARGTVFSNGIGIVVLKRLEDALCDHDRIYATVSGWAVNNDGNKKVSYTAPSVDGQANAIMMAQSFAGILPEDVSYIEAHGTGTSLGDPIEIAALTKAFSFKTDMKQFCGVGSVKSNIGHTDAAAGVASFIKASLSAYYKKIPPSLNFTEPNPQIDFENTPFFVQTELTEWSDIKPLIIGVSSFGIGGTNAHVIVEEPPRIDFGEMENSCWPNLVVVSAKSESALTKRKNDLKSYIAVQKNLKFENLVYTLQSGRCHMPYRSFYATQAVSDVDTEEIIFIDGKANESIKHITFVFPGQGAQYLNMGRDLYENIPDFKNTLDTAFAIYKKLTGHDLKSIIFNSQNDENAEVLLAQTQYTQPSLFIIEYALANSFLNFGITPDYLIGHSIGEYAAACVSGVFDLETALKIVIKRGQLMQSMPSGKMLAVRGSMDSLKLLESSLFEIAAENTLNSCTISLKTENIEAVTSLLESRKISYVPLNTSHAFHSMAFDPILDEFNNYINQFSLNLPTIPFVSSLTGQFIEDHEAQSGNYWANQLRHTVLFEKGISEIVGQGNSFFIEIGPNTHLSSFIRPNKLVTNKTSIITSLGKAEKDINDRVSIVNALGHLWNNGYHLAFNKIVEDSNAYKITLPGYPFERRRCWVDYFPSIKDLPLSSINEDANCKEVVTELITQDEPAKLKHSIKNLLSELSGFSIYDIHDNIRFSDLGFDSLFLAYFVEKLEQNYSIKILFRELVSNYSTIEKLVTYINSHVDKAEESFKEVQIFSNKNLKNLGFLNKVGTKTPFILVHGSNSVNFLSQYFEGERPILNFFDIGSDGERIKCKSIDDMAQLYIDQLLDLLPSGPYVFCGFSFGGLLAYKMAELLNNSDKNQVSCIILFDCKTPQVAEPNKIKKIMSIIEGNKLNFLLNAVVRRIKKIRLYYVFFLFKKPLPIKFRRRYISSVYFKLSKNYKPASVNSEILLFRSEESLAYDPYMGWKKLVNNVELMYLEGNHLGIIYLKKNYNIISDKIGTFLKKCNC